MKRVGLKYCGGCNPSYDRVKYVRRIQKAAGTRIEWVHVEEAVGFDVVVIVTGCDRACVEGIEYEKAGLRVVRIRHVGRAPEEMVSLLLDEGTRHD